MWIALNILPRNIKDIICFLTITGRVFHVCFQMDCFPVLGPGNWCWYVLDSNAVYCFWLFWYPLVISHCGQFIAAHVLVFSLCFVYEQYEEKIDEIAVIVYTIACKLTVLLAGKLPKPSSSYNPLMEKGSNRSLLDGRQ